MYTSNTSGIIIQSKPQVVFKNWVWNIDATFDFSKIHPDLHLPMINWLMRQYRENNTSHIKEVKKDNSWLGKIWRIKLW